MSYLLDTDIVIDRLQGDPATIQLLTTLAGQGIAISIITYIEIQQGVLLGPDPVKERATFEAFLRTQRLLPLSLAVADRCAAIRADLTRRKRRVRQRSLDLIVAAAALEHGLTLVTRNKADYQDIPGLTLY